MKNLNRLALSICLAAPLIGICQGIPATQWTNSERQFVENARQLYQQQGIAYSDEQASLAVQQMRMRDGSIQRGIPESQWTPQERAYIEEVRRQYTARGNNFSTEQAQMAVQSMRDQMSKMMGGIGALQAAQSMGGVASTVPQQSNYQQPGNNYPTEDALYRQIASLGRPTEPITVKGRRDGFDVNGSPVIDAEGAIFNYAFDVTTGDITYAAKTPRGVTIKTISSSPNAQPVVIATGTQGRAGWEIQTVTGKALSGGTLTVLSNGFLVGRGSSAFRYQPGKGVQNIAIPDGYSITPLQRGNVGATGYVLIEKEGATGGSDSFSQLLSSVKSIGATLGVNKKADYALMDTKTGKTYPINISANGKQQTLMSQCRQMNWLVSECQKAQTFEAVYGADGMKNNSHYYWLVNWTGTPSGPVAFSLEDGLGKLSITDLNSGKKAIAFERSLGIADWDIRQTGDTKVAVKAKLAFDWKEISDAVNFVQLNGAIPKSE